MPTVGKFELKDVTIGWIRNTMELGVLAFSENLLPELQRNPDIEVLGEPFDVPFDSTGNLVSVVREQHAGAAYAPAH
jgi:hypothetical protein